MKTCPACRTQYSDDTLRFCLQDGSVLSDSLDVETPTVVLGETDTVTSFRGRDAINVPIGGRRSQHWNGTVTPETRSSHTTLAVVLTAAGMLFLFGVVGIGAWLFLKNGPGDVAKNTANLENQVNRDANTLPTPNSNALPSPTRQSSTPLPTPTTNRPLADDSQIRNEVSQTIYSWKSMTESKNLGSLRASYADTLDYYYTRRNVSSRTVMADKQRAFSSFSSLRINVSIASVTPNASGESATAVYNKEWTFNGTKPFCGTIRSQMLLRKINGTWLIAGEKDVPGTFKRTC